MNNCGIDTIKLRTRNYNCDVEYLKDNEYLIDIKGTMNSGLNATYSKLIKNGNNDRKCNIKVNGAELVIECSIPKYLDRNNLDLASKNDIQLFTDNLYTLMRENRIDVDVGELKLSRVDITQNADMKYKSVDYMKLLHNLKCRYMKRDRTKSYDTSMTWGNTKKVYCVYDKMNELNNTISNNLRSEKRFFENRLIEKRLGISSLNELHKNYADVIDSANYNLKKDIFDIKTENELNKELCIGLENVIDNIFSKKKLSRYKYVNSINELIMLYGIVRLKEMYSVDTIIQLIDQKYMNDLSAERRKVYKYRMKRHLEKWYDISLLNYNNLTDVIDYMKLYTEIKQKLM